MNFEKFRRGEDGFWKTPTSDCSIGIVLFVRCGSSFVMIQKEAKPGYEFSSLFALPGGMVRFSNYPNFRDALNDSLKKRLMSETGLHLDMLSNLNIREIAQCPVTSYSVKGQKKYTLVTSATALIAEEDLDLASTDKSISAVTLQPCSNPPWEKMSPANRLIVFEILESTLGKKQIDIATESVLKSKKQCREWAAEIGETSQV